MSGAIKSGILLLCILLIGGALRVKRMNWDGLNFDEQWHVEISTGRGSEHIRLPQDTVIPDAPRLTTLENAPPIHAIWSNMDWVVHPPLYCTFLRVWRDIFGESDAAAKSFSVFCSLVAIGLMYQAARMRSGEFTGLWAAAILALAPTQVFLAPQVRGYELLMALGMGAVVCLAFIEQTNGSRRAIIALAICVIGMMLTHYFAIGACAAIGVYVIAKFRGKIRTETMIALALSGLIYAGIWGPFLWQQRGYFSSTADSWLMENTPEHIAETWIRIASRPWFMLIGHDFNTNLPLLGGVAIIGWIMLLYWRRDLLIWVLWMIGTLGFIGFLDLYRGTAHLRYERYVSLFSPALCVLIAASVSRLHISVRHILPAALAVFLFLNWKAAFESEEPIDWPGYGKALDAHVLPGEALVFFSGRHPRVFNDVYYLAATHYSKQFPRTILKLSKPASPELMAALPGPTAWLITGPPDRPVEQVLPGVQILGSPIVLDGPLYCTQVRLPSQNNP